MQPRRQQQTLDLVEKTSPLPSFPVRRFNVHHTGFEFIALGSTVTRYMLLTFTSMHTLLCVCVCVCVFIQVGKWGKIVCERFNTCVCIIVVCVCVREREREIHILWNDRRKFFSDKRKCLWHIHVRERSLIGYYDHHGLFFVFFYLEPF